MFDIVPGGNVPGVSDKLIDRIADAVGWRTTSITKRMGIEAFVDEIKKSNLDPLEKAALISNAGKIIKEYTNQTNIVKKAIPMISNNAHPEEIEEDWLAVFMDNARLISDEEVQLMWAKVLAKETEKPGSYSLRTLDTLKNLNKEEAVLFQKISKLAVYYSDNVRIIDGDKKLKDRFNEILSLEECGLISSSLVTTTINLTTEEKRLLLYDNNVCGFFSSKEGTCKFKYNAYVFTKTGSELFRIVDVDRDSDILLNDLRKIAEDNLNIKIDAYRVKKIEGTIVHYDSSTNILENYEKTY